MLTKDAEKPETRVLTRKERLYRVPINSATLGDVIDFLEEFHLKGDPLQMEMVQVNFNIE